MKWFVALCLFGFLSHSHAATVTLTNAASITISAVGAASPNPSTINVAGFPNQIVTSAMVTLRGFEHSFPDDVDILLELPSGLALLLMSDCGSSLGVTNVTLVFDDAAAQHLGDSA